tara:strand:+ start:227 stop:385 length:159 start_codon:yes stop_codon:yes gene_type:complete
MHRKGVTQKSQTSYFDGRPFHCANQKNKQWYVKDENVGWQQDGGEKIISNTE